VVLPDQSVSRRHAEIRLDPSGAGLIVTDLGSAAGTFVGTEALLPSRPVVVPPGEPIRIGPFVLSWAPAAIRFEIAGRQVAPQPETWSPPPRVSEANIVPIEARPTFPIPTALGPCSRYLTDLPAMFQDNGASSSANGGPPDLSDSTAPKVPFLGRMLLIFESL
jgi:hypothetical protein